MKTAGANIEENDAKIKPLENLVGPSKEDSGASDHMVKDWNCFEDLYRLPHMISIAFAQSGWLRNMLKQSEPVRTFIEVDEKVLIGR